MAREIVISIWCDPCLTLDDVHTEGEELPPITIGNSKPRVMAMCKEHRENFYEPFVEALNQMGALADHLGTEKRPAKVRSAAASSPSMASETPSGLRIVCPSCDRTAKNVSSLTTHMRTTHKTRLRDVLGDDGQLVDTAGNAVPTPKPRRARSA